MRTKREASARPRGLSLLEMMVATTIMATLMASVVVVMRSGYAVWNAQEDDIDVLENGYGVLRHFAQQMRQAESITAISDPSDTTGDLSFVSASGRRALGAMTAPRKKSLSTTAPAAVCWRRTSTRCRLPLTKPTGPRKPRRSTIFRW